MPSALRSGLVSAPRNCEINPTKPIAAATNTTASAATMPARSQPRGAAIGVFGVMAYSVQQRAREFGIRLALGAQPKNVRNLVLADGMRIAMCGTVIGLAGAFGLSQLLKGFLFGVTQHDPVVVVATPLVLVSIALTAMWVPARRASRVDPATALRSE